MSENTTTLALLRTIAKANGTSIEAFLMPGRRVEPGVYARPRGPYRHAALLPRLFKAYFALPGVESRLHALRMMEAMAAQAKGVNGDATS